MNEDKKEEDPQAPTVQIKQNTELPLLPHPSTLFDCTLHMNRPKSWKEDGIKVTFRYVKTMTESDKGYLKWKYNKWHFVPADPTQ